MSTCQVNVEQVCSSFMISTNLVCSSDLVIFLFIYLFFLSSFWGKFAQRSNMTQVQMINDPERYFDLLTSDAVEVQNARFCK